MKETHPLKRKSIKPSASTIRGMLPGPQFRALDAAMQSLRSAGLRLEWAWKDKDLGWVCMGLLGEDTVCTLVPTADPFVGRIELTRAQQKAAGEHPDMPKKFKVVLAHPGEETKTRVVYEFELNTTAERDLLSDFVEAVAPFFEDAEA